MSLRPWTKEYPNNVPAEMNEFGICDRTEPVSGGRVGTRRIACILSGALTMSYGEVDAAS